MPLLAWMFMLLSWTVAIIGWLLFLIRDSDAKENLQGWLAERNECDRRIKALNRAWRNRLAALARMNPPES